MTLNQAIKELYFWQYGTNPTNFHAVLYSLFSKADPINFAKLQGAFSNEANAFMLWQSAPDEKVFFDAWMKDIK